MKFIEPLRLIKANDLPFKYWLLFTILAGQSGIILNIIIGVYRDNESIWCILEDSYLNGEFYTYSIALLSSMIGLVFLDLISADSQHFRQIKLNTIIIGALLLGFSAVTYPFMSKGDLEWTQLVIYILSISLAIYFYALLKLEENHKKFEHLYDIDYSKADDDTVDNIKKSAETTNTDKKGNKL